MGNCFGYCVDQYHLRQDLRELAKCDANTPMFNFRCGRIPAKCTKCYDGDTVHLCFKFRNQFDRHRCRLIGIDAPEMTSKNPAEKQEAIRARDALAAMILNHNITVECGETDLYGRPLVTIYRGDQNVNQEMIRLGLAYEYNGKTKRSFEDWHE